MVLDEKQRRAQAHQMKRNTVDENNPGMAWPVRPSITYAGRKGK